VASENHFKRLKDSVQNVTVLGYLPRDLDFEIPHRHLGLTVAEENPITAENIQRLANAALGHMDVDAILSSIPPFNSPLEKGQEGDCPRFTGAAVESGLSPTSAKIKIAVAYDKAFCFYYEDNLDLLKGAGAEIIKFSPLSDSVIPDTADAVYIGGGYPELYAEALSKNKSMIEDIYKWAISGKPIYAECGGLMYLSKGIYYTPPTPFNKGEYYAMAGVLPFETEMKKGESHLGYREIILKEDCILGKEGDKLRGHEFHYSEIINNSYELGVMSYELKNKKNSRLQTWDSLLSEGTVPDLRTERSGVVESGLSPLAIDKIYSVRNNYGELVNASGYTFKNTIASYIHVHFGSNPDITNNFINFTREH
jgi:cobyrinic acid a,c-diamide synthase